MLSEIPIKARLQKPFALPSSLEGADCKPGFVVAWEPSANFLRSLRQLPSVIQPCSYQQEQHLLHYKSLKRQQLDKERLLVVTWDMPGHCKLDRMSMAINRHLQRHDTYHAWHHLDENDAQGKTCRLIEALKIQLNPTHLGWMECSEWIHRLLRTPGSDEWNCFQFGIIQRENEFTFFVCMDHLYADGRILSIIYSEIRADYQSLASDNKPKTFRPTSSYLDYCQRQRRESSRLTLENPDIQHWLHFLRSNGGQLPRWPLELQDAAETWHSNITTLSVLNTAETENFVRNCRSNGVHFLIGMLSSFAVAENILTGRNEVHLVTPVSNRTTRTELRTMGWFTGLVPVSISGFELGMETVMQRAYQSFASRRHLASIPIERLVELTSGLSEIHWPSSGGFMFSCGLLTSDKLMGSFYASNGCFYMNESRSGGIALWITKSCQGVSASISHPASPEAKDTVRRFMETFTNICKGVSMGKLVSVLETR